MYRCIYIYIGDTIWHALFNEYSSLYVFCITIPRRKQQFNHLLSNRYSKVFRSINSIHI